MSYNTTEMISSIKAIASIPTSQNLFQTADFLRFANHELQTRIVPLLMSVREEFFVADHDYNVTADKSAYSVPKRAIGGKLRDVQLISGTTIKSLPRLEPSDITSTSGDSEGFYMKGGNVILCPTPTSTTGTLRLPHFRRPGKLVQTSACGQITSINIGANTVEITSTPSTFATGVLCDLIKNDPGFECHAIDQTITSITGTTIGFASLPSDLAVGDWIALATESPIPQIPVELHPLLHHLSAIKCLLALGKKAEAERIKVDEMQNDALKMLTPRIDGENKKFTNHGSLLNHWRYR